MILNYCNTVYKTADMGCKGIQSVLDYAQRMPLKDKLKDQYEEYSDLCKQPRTHLKQDKNYLRVQVHLAMASANFMTVGKMMVDHTDSKIAKMTIRGNQKGIYRTIKHLHDYSGQKAQHVPWQKTFWLQSNLMLNN